MEGPPYHSSTPITNTPPVPHTHLRNPLPPSDERGQTLAEYSLLVALIAIVVAVVLPTLGSQIAAMFSQFAAAF